MKQSEVLNMIKGKLAPEEKDNKIMNLLTLMAQQSPYMPMTPQNEAMPQPEPTMENIGANLSSVNPAEKYKFLRKGQV
jgi:hypothetical protein